VTTIAERLQQLTPGSIVEMYEIDISPITKTNTASDHLYFFNDINPQGQPLVWKGILYQPWAVKAEGFEMTTKGAMPRPSFVVGNTSGVVTALCVAYDDLVGARFIRRRTLVEYLDAANFVGGNATADSTQELPDDVFFIERKVTANRMSVEWELSSAMDFQGVMLPSRIITATYCPWRYRSAECSKTGTSNMFDVNGNTVTSQALDVCAKTLSACKLRFGAKNPLPFGGFPASRVYKG